MINLFSAQLQKLPLSLDPNRYAKKIVGSMVYEFQASIVGINLIISILASVAIKSQAFKPLRNC